MDHGRSFYPQYISMTLRDNTERWETIYLGINEISASINRQSLQSWKTCFPDLGSRDGKSRCGMDMQQNGSWMYWWSWGKNPPATLHTWQGCGV